ncbi:MAG TPA: hypothetical protein VF142_18540 [Longimicrobium sp.]
MEKRPMCPYQPDGWTTGGEKTTSDENLARVRHAANAVGGIADAGGAVPRRGAC